MTAMTANTAPDKPEGIPLVWRIEGVVAPLACAGIAAVFAVALYLRVAG